MRGNKELHMSKVDLYDTTLRDGAQMEGISFSVQDMLRIAKKLDEFGIQYIEGGWPGSNPKTMTFFKEAKSLCLKNSKITAFGSTRRKDKTAQTDPNIKALIQSGAKIATIFGKTSELHVKEVLRASLDENLKMIEDTVKYLDKKFDKVFFDAEHFFDAYKENPVYALKAITVAKDSGAKCIIFCDTNGGTIPTDIFKIVEEVKSKINIPLGIHAHNDSDLAVANSLVAIEAGCTQVQGTINGYGERCGNANLIPIIANLKLKMNIDCITQLSLTELTELSRFVAEISNMKLEDSRPFVGNSAFAHKAGVHVNAVLKNPKSYEHIDPTLVGNRRRLLVSELGGKSSILSKAIETDVELKKDETKAKKILKLVQELEHQGYTFEAAEASFELLMKKAVKKIEKFFELQDFRVIVERRDKKLTSEAIIKLKVKGKLEHTAALGDGPVNALDNALRKALENFYPNLRQMHLSDFKVRVLDEKSGTAAKVRVLIQSQDKEDSWWTIGVSENLIDASWHALVDSIEYKLLKDLGKKK